MFGYRVGMFFIYLGVIALSVFAATLNAEAANVPALLLGVASMTLGILLRVRLRPPPPPPSPGLRDRLRGGKKDQTK